MKIVFEKNSKPQFSKVWLVACIIISLVFTSASYLLAVFDKDPLAGVTTELLGTLWGASGTSFLGYAVQNCVRAYTSSKFGLPDSEQPDAETEDDDEDIIYR